MLLQMLAFSELHDTIKPLPEGEVSVWERFPVELSPRYMFVRVWRYVLPCCGVKYTLTGDAFRK